MKFKSLFYVFFMCNMLSKLATRKSTHTKSIPDMIKLIQAVFLNPLNRRVCFADVIVFRRRNNSIGWQVTEDFCQGCTVYHLPYNERIKGTTQSIFVTKLVNTLAECAQICAKTGWCESALFVKTRAWHRSPCYLTEDVGLCAAVMTKPRKDNFKRSSKLYRPAYCIQCHNYAMSSNDDDGVTIETVDDDQPVEDHFDFDAANLVHYKQNWSKVSTEFEVERNGKKDSQMRSSQSIYDDRAGLQSLEAFISELPKSIPTLPITKPTPTSRLRVITFNLWRGANNVHNGLQKVAKHINFNNPDVVCLQEVYGSDRIEELLQILGSSWTACKKTSAEQINYIITRHQIMEEYEPASLVLNNGCRIRVGNSKEFNIWNVHLHWDTYGPYAACNRGMTSLVTLLYCEYHLGSGKNGRMQNLLSLINHKEFVHNLVQSEQGIPLLVAGDFNSPSHLDWTNATANSHCGWQFGWPVSSTMNDYGFTDSYRETNPDPLRHPGNTWSPIVKYLDGWNMLLPEPQDRIDYIYYKGGSIRALYSTEYHGNRPLAIAPGAKDNDWPSDHSAVITEFEIE